MRLELMLAVFRKELRETLRDRRSVIVMFGIPLLLYPIVTLAVGSMLGSRQKEIAEKQYRVVVTNAAGAPRLVALMEAKDSGVRIASKSDSAAALAREEIDAVLDLPADLDEKARRADEVKVLIRIDRSRTEAPVVERKLRRIVGDYEQEVIRGRLKERQVPETLLRTIDAETLDIATRDQRMGKILSVMLPIILMITGMLGALFPALNATTTERESGTLEALLATPVRKLELLLAKGAIVFLASAVTAALNLISMSLVMWRVVSSFGLGAPMRVNFGALAMSFVAVVPSLIFFSALVMIVGLLARSFREANSYATPVMLIPLLSLVVTIGEPKATPALLVTPVLNTALVIRDVLVGHASIRAFLLALVSSCLYAGLMLSAASRMFTSEQLVNPTWEPLSLRGLRGGGGRQRRWPAVDEAMVLFVLVLLLTFYISPSLGTLGFLPVVTGNELLLIALPTLLFAALARYRWREVFSFRAAPMTGYAGAALIGLGMALAIDLLTLLQEKIWPYTPEQARQQVELIIPTLLRHPFLTAALVGVLAGVCEELLFRGPIQTALARRFSLWPTLIIGGLLFGAAHMDVHGLVLRAVAALPLGWLVYRGGSIYPAMLAHGLYDASKLLTVWIEVRGRSPEQVLTDLNQGASLWDVLIRAAIGAVLLVAGWLMCRRIFYRNAPSAPAEVAASAPS